MVNAEIGFLGAPGACLCLVRQTGLGARRGFVGQFAVPIYSAVPFAQFRGFRGAARLGAWLTLRLVSLRSLRLPVPG